MTETVETITEGSKRVRIVVDDSPANPREFYECYARFIPRRGRLREDAAPGNDLEDSWKRLIENCDESKALEIFTRYVGLMGGAAIHDYYYLWYCLPDDTLLSVAMEVILESERETYSQWAEGDVYGLVTETLIPSTCDLQDSRDELGADAAYDDVVANADASTWHEVESVWGYYGYDYALTEAKEWLGV